MKDGYRPDMSGFSRRLGLKNGLEELLARPVPRQEILYCERDDIIDGGGTAQYNRQKSFAPRRKKWRR